MLKKVGLDKINTLHNHWVDFDSRELWIHGMDSTVDKTYEGEEPGVEYMMATRVIKNLHLLRKQSSRAKVLIHLHSCGGVWEEGMAIYDNIKLMPYPVTMISHTHARSMSSIILQAADERFLLPSSYFLFHRGTLYLSGEAQGVLSGADWSKETEDVMLDVYVSKAINGPKFKGCTSDQVRKTIIEAMNTKVDVYLTAKEAIEWGFADGILESWPSHASWSSEKQV